MRDIKTISVKDWIVYIGASLLVLASVLISVDYKIKIDSRFEFIALTAALTFGMILESAWCYRNKPKFWIAIGVLIALHLSVLPYVLPKDIAINWLLPFSLLESSVIMMILGRLGFPEALRLRPKENADSIRPSRSLLIHGAMVCAISSALVLLIYVMRSRINADVSAASTYVLFLCASYGIGIVLVGAGRWLVGHFRKAPSEA